ncbi:MAG: hypothetical protein HC904_14400 [Blastochloris sp.]|nr:hypothetical protein [Blastochloris sp.]
MKQFPQEPFSPLALWFKGQAELALGQHEEAWKSWSRLVELGSDFEQRRELLWQGALLAGNLKKYAEMERLLLLFVNEFSKDGLQAEAHALLAQARQEQGAETDAAAFWARARDLDPARYTLEATQQRIRIALSRADLKTLRAEVEIYDQWRLKHRDIPELSLEVMEWLGQQIMEQTAKAEEAEPYLRRVLASSKAATQRKRVQLRLALLMSQLKKHGAALREWQLYRVNFPEEANRSPVLEPLALAMIGAAEYDEAQKIAEQILRQNPEGTYNAKGRLLLGDIQMARRNPREAAKIFSAVSLLVDDLELTPLALARAEKAYRLSGDNAKADEFFITSKKAISGEVG